MRQLRRWRHPSILLEIRCGAVFVQFFAGEPLLPQVPDRIAVLGRHLIVFLLLPVRRCTRSR